MELEPNVPGFYQTFAGIDEATGEATCYVEGEVDIHTSQDMSRVLENLTGNTKVRSIVVDLTQTKFMDLTGITALLRARRDFANRVDPAQPEIIGNQLEERSFRVHNPSKHLYKIMNICSLIERLGVTVDYGDPAETQGAEENL